jgi:membrane-anchored protein YejM (alkaline phosphatase superfamily)
VGAEKGGVANAMLPDGMTVTADQRRHDWRRFANSRFRGRVDSAEIDAYTQTYEQALRLMERRELFDITREPAKIQDAYGKSEFGKQLLLARRLVEQEVPFVEVSNDGWDFHHNNFEFHLHYVGNFDTPFAHFLEDLAQRGHLERTLVIVMTEFGRTPRINTGYGRDHYSRAWSIALAGCGIQHGAVIGKTDPKGIDVVDREVDHRHLFHTYLQAVGINSASEFEIAGRKFPIADPAVGPIRELLR